MKHRHRSRQRSRLAAATNTRSAGRYAGRGVWRRRTASCWRRMTISTAIGARVGAVGAGTRRWLPGSRRAIVAPTGQSGGLHSPGSHTANRAVNATMCGRPHCSSKPSPLIAIGLLDPTGRCRFKNAVGAQGISDDMPVVKPLLTRATTIRPCR